MRKQKNETETQPIMKKTKKDMSFFQKLKRAVIIVCVIIVLAGAIVAGAALGFIDNSTDLIAQEKNLDFSSVIYYIDEKTNEPKEFDRLYADQNRIWVDLDATPEMLQKAFIAIEDERFLTHKGVDWKRTFGATLGYVFKGNNSYGGSTITQQLIKNITGDDKRSPIRKIQEIVRALNLEQKMSKDEILEMYMNTIYLGQGCHGVQTASNVYYSKDVSQLTLAECASIAGITQYPSRYDPLVNFDAHKQKQELVLSKMLELEFITQEEYDKAMAEELKLVKGTAKTKNSRIQSYYTDQIISDVLKDLMEQKHMSESVATKLLYKGGLKIYANVDPVVQNAMEAVFSNNSNFPGSGSNGPQSAMAVIDPYTGQVKGLVGGRGTKEGNRVLNRATQSLRQPGSSIKPLAVYAPAVEKGVVTPAEMVSDTPLTMGDWSPKNSDSKFMGPISTRVALEKSRNIPAVRILDELGVNDSFSFMTNKLGFTSLVSAEKREDGKMYSDKNLSSLALGGLTDGVSVLEMTAAYSTFVNGGIYTPPTTYSKVIDPNGRIILETKVKSKRAMSETTAYTMANMLTGVVKHGTGTGARLANGVFCGGKTGTTDQDIDRWFVGITPNYAAAVWFGYDIPKSMSGLGNPCTSVWKKVMDTIHKDIGTKTILEPRNMTERVICQQSGLIATTECSNVRTEFFKSGTQPSSFCESHDIADELEGVVENEPMQSPEPGTEGEDGGSGDGEAQETTPPSESSSEPLPPDDSAYWWSGDE